MSIIAIDLGKFKSMVCFYETGSGKHSFAKAKTEKGYFRSLLKNHHADLVVVEACGPSGNAMQAKNSLDSVRADYPILLSRSIQNAKDWVRSAARGIERYGLLTSSGARRLKPLGIVAGSVRGNECNWFLDNDQDVRSSYYLEDAATEFEVQGLENTVFKPVPIKPSFHVI